MDFPELLIPACRHTAPDIASRQGITMSQEYVLMLYRNLSSRYNLSAIRGFSSPGDTISGNPAGYRFQPQTGARLFAQLPYGGRCRDRRHHPPFPGRVA